MKTLFPKTRIVLQAVAGISPFILALILASFADQPLILLMVILLSILTFLGELPKSVRFSGRRLTNFVATARYISAILVIWAVSSNPIFLEISQRLADQRAFYDWRFVTAAIVITMVFSVQQVMKVRAWDDRRIYDLIGGGADSQSKESAERL